MIIICVTLIQCVHVCIQMHVHSVCMSGEVEGEKTPHECFVHWARHYYTLIAWTRSGVKSRYLVSFVLFALRDLGLYASARLSWSFSASFSSCKALVSFMRESTFCFHISSRDLDPDPAE